MGSHDTLWYKLSRLEFLLGNGRPGPHHFIEIWVHRCSMFESLHSIEQCLWLFDRISGKLGFPFYRDFGWFWLINSDHLRISIYHSIDNSCVFQKHKNFHFIEFTGCMTSRAFKCHVLRFSILYRETCRNMFEQTEVLSKNETKNSIEWNFEDFQGRPEK